MLAINIEKQARNLEEEEEETREEVAENIFFSSNSAHAAHRVHYKSGPRTQTQDKTVGHKDKCFPPFPLLSAGKKKIK